MTPRLCLAFVIAAFGGLVQPPSAEACACAGTASSSTAFKGAELVFVGTVTRVEGRDLQARTNTDGTVRVEPGTGQPVTIFDAAHVFRGGVERQIAIMGDRTDCDVRFTQGEMWLVYARVREGRVVTDQCTRTRLQAEAEASQDLAYLEGLEQGRPQGILYGEVLRRIVGRDGQPALQALFGPLQVIAAGAGRRLQVTTDRSGPYQLVLPPGDFEVWVEDAGRTVASAQKVHVDNGSDLRLMLVVE